MTGAGRVLRGAGTRAWAAGFRVSPGWRWAAAGGGPGGRFAVPCARAEGADGAPDRRPDSQSVDSGLRRDDGRGAGAGSAGGGDSGSGEWVPGFVGRRGGGTRWAVSGFRLSPGWRGAGRRARACGVRGSPGRRGARWGHNRAFRRTAARGCWDGLWAAPRVRSWPLPAPVFGGHLGALELSFGFAPLTTTGGAGIRFEAAARAVRRRRRLLPPRPRRGAGDFGFSAFSGAGRGPAGSALSSELRGSASARAAERSAGAHPPVWHLARRFGEAGTTRQEDRGGGPVSRGAASHSEDSVCDAGRRVRHRGGDAGPQLAP